MCKYLLDLIGFNADKPEDYYDSKLQLSTLHMYDFRKVCKMWCLLNLVLENLKYLQFY